MRVWLIIGWLLVGFWGAQAAEPLREFTILAVGDTGFNASLERVEPDAGRKRGERITFADATAGVDALIDGDINFANLETIVTDRNDLDAIPKAFNFRMHPSGFRHLLSRGFNVFSTANNHAMDFGPGGAAETLRHLATMPAGQLLAYPGLGQGRRSAGSAHVIAWEDGRFRRFDPVRDVAPALLPAAFEIERGIPVSRRTPDFTLAISAIGIGGQSFPPGEARAGQLSFPDGEDYIETLDRLRATLADFRILSVHYGIENRTLTDENTVQRFRRQAILSGAADMIIGHHHHVVNGIEIANGRPIFYGMGNFIHFGTRDIGGSGICRDYGLMAKVHFSVDGERRATLQSIEAIALTGTHKRVRPMGAADGKRRIDVLNTLAAQFDRAGERARGVRFQARSDGSGLYCAQGAGTLGGRIGKLCGGYDGPVYPAEFVQASIRNDCAPLTAELVLEE
jgi:poly-gamma-glutamate synthesis protein (capsule biosynthesis protein)